jgi:hypothetical protein
MEEELCQMPLNKFPVSKSNSMLSYFACCSCSLDFHLVLFVEGP